MKKLFIASLLVSTVAAGIYYYSAQQNTAPDFETIGSEFVSAGAQDTTQAGNKTATRGARIDKAAVMNGDIPEVDETALRYFAMKGDKARLQAEIERLKALYPHWSPPENPLAPAQTHDTKLDQLWKLFADGQFAELRKAIATRKMQEPGWEAPADMIAKLDLAEARQRLINASDNKQYDMVVSLAAQTPQLLTCNEVDVMWRLSEAFAKQDKPDRARDGYLYLLKNCTNPEERLVTVQKALDTLPYAQAQQILAQQKTTTDGKGEFAAIRDDIARRFVADAAENPELEIDKTYLSSLETMAEKEGKATDAEMLGWYYLRRDQLPEAQKWFVIAKDKENSATVAQGLALILNERADFAQAEAVMYPWRDSSDDAAAVYFAATANLLASDPPERMPATIAQDVMTRIAQAVVLDKDVTTAEQLGWYARAIGQNPTAIQWFQTALSWDPAHEPSAYGLTVSLHAAGDKAGVAQMKQAWAQQSQRIADVGTERDKYSRRPVQAVSQASQPRQQPKVQRAEPVRRSARSSASNKNSCRQTLAGPVPTGGRAVAHGWCLMELNRPLEAVKSFESALNTGSAQERADAAYGQSLAYLRVGLVDKAAVSAIKAPMSQKRQKELRVSILSDRAVAAYRAGQFRDTLFILQQRAQLAPPRKDLMALQAASYLKLRRYDDARVLYEALAATGDREGIRGMAALRDIQGFN